VRDVSVSRALEQISEIHGHLARTHVYRGWRPVPCALSGAIGMAGVVWQLVVEPPATAWAFVIAWSIVAAVAIVVGCAEIAWHYTRASVSERHRARHVFAQAVPAVVAAIIITVVLINTNPALVMLLPGVWALMFGVGMFAARPFVPSGSGWVALYYWLAGIVVLSVHAAGPMPSPWAVGGVFGVGQTLAALVLWKEERRVNEEG
jgi:hypothetical protein